MSTKRTIIYNASSSPERVKYIERDKGYYTERMLKPVKPQENNVTGSYAHINSRVRIDNGSVYCRNAHADVFEEGHREKQTSLSNSDIVVVTTDEPAAVSEEPATIMPMGDAVSSIGFNQTHVSVDDGTAVAWLPANETQD